MNGRFAFRLFGATIEWFMRVPPRSADADLFHRTRVVVAFGWALVALAVIYSAIFFAMDSPIGGLVLGAGAIVIVCSIWVMRRTGSCFIAGNLLTAAFFAVLTALACRLGGIGAASLAWYVAVPVVALSTVGQCSTVFWLAATFSSLLAFYTLQYHGYAFPNDLTPYYVKLLDLLSILGLTVLTLGLTQLYEMAKRQTLAACKQAEEQLQESFAELERFNRLIVSANEALEESAVAAEVANRAKSEFLANMSHELRTPMTAILGFSDVLLANMTDCEQFEAVATIKRNGEYLIDLINDILDLSKIEAGKLEVECIPCSPRQILSEVVSLMRVRANAKNVALVLDYEGPMPETIQSDSTRLRQILINLIGNAIKFTEAGRVHVLARLLDGQSPEPKMQFQVADTGIGMSEEQIARLFQPFSQLDTSTTRKYGGTGLGLTISKRLAEKLGGSVAVTSAPGTGSAFTVTVATGPLHGVRLLDNPLQERASAAPENRADKFNAKLACRVLLVEDGPDNQRLIAFLLRRAGADVTLAENGQIACDQAQAAQDAGLPVDVILMDMQMPVMDGYDATRKLRATGYAGPIIALTAHAMKSDQDKCLKAGCDDYMTKPIDHTKLIAVVAKHAVSRSAILPLT